MCTKYWSEIILKMVSYSGWRKTYLYLFATGPPFKAGCMFQHVELLLQQQLNEPLVESTTMLLWETPEESKQRRACSRPGFLGASFGKRSHGRLAWSMSWWLPFVSNGLKEGGEKKKRCSMTQEKETGKRRRLKTSWEKATYLWD